MKEELKKYRAEILIYLLTKFNDFDNPLLMEAETVRQLLDNYFDDMEDNI